MNITIHNYEAYLLDLTDGNLKPAEEKELHEFMNLHPELQYEKNCRDLKLPTDFIAYPNKSTLKKFDFDQNISDRNVEDFCIASHEKLLSEGQSEKLQQFLTGSEMRRFFDLYGKTYLKPQSEIRYPGKKELYRKKSRLKLYFIIPAAAAASVAIIFTLLKPSHDIIPTNSIKSLNEEVATIYLPTKVKMSTAILHFAKKQTPKAIRVEETVEPPQEREPSPKTLASKPILISNPGKEQLAFLVEPEQPLAESYTESKEGLISIAAKALVELKGEENKIMEIKRSRQSLFKIVKAGIDGINSMTESEMNLTEKSDSEGNITAYSFESALVKIRHHVAND